MTTLDLFNHEIVLMFDFFNLIGYF